MFLHIGGSQIIFDNELIGIFKIELTENPVNRHFLEQVKTSSSRHQSKEQGIKSFVVTDGAIQVSPISPLTLSKRNRVSG